MSIKGGPKLRIFDEMLKGGQGFASAYGKPFFEMCCSHMDITQIAIDPSTPPSSVKQAPWGTFLDPIFSAVFYIAKIT